MKLEIFSILDIKTNVFNTPWFSRTQPDGVRSFKSVANDPSSFISKYPDDYHLYHLGTYEDTAGAFELAPKPLFITSGRHVVEQKPEYPSLFAADDPRN